MRLAVSTSWARVMAAEVVAPVLMASRAPSYALVVNACLTKMALEASMLPRTIIIRTGRQTANSTNAAPRLETDCRLSIRLCNVTFDLQTINCLSTFRCPTGLVWKSSYKSSIQIERQRLPEVAFSKLDRLGRFSTCNSRERTSHSNDRPSESIG